MICPVCHTTNTDHSTEERECGGEGGCPAREAGTRPTPQYVLCACNRRWLSTPETILTEVGSEHAFDDCYYVKDKP